jgi:shikimate dehydrogenase
MHNAAFAKLGMDACYVPCAVHPDHLEAAVRGIRALNLKGLNVTVPHKQAVMSWLDELSEEARLIGAVNTIEVQGDRLKGHNTDGRGFLRSLKDDAGFNPRGKRVVFIGSGGAARAVGFSLALAGARSIVFMDLDHTKSHGTGGGHQAKTGADVHAIGEPAFRYAAGADCLINATPLGLKKTDPLPMRKELIQNTSSATWCKPAGNALLEGCKGPQGPALGYRHAPVPGVIALRSGRRKSPVRIMKNALARQIRARR